MAADLACDKFWVNKSLYHDAEKRYYENLAKLRKNGQDSVQESEEKKEDSNSKKNKENKKLQLKNQKNLNNLLDVEILRNELLSLEAEYAKSENLNDQSEKINTIESIKRNEENTDTKNNGSVEFEKKAKQKEIKEKKSKNEKKAKKAKNREDDSMGGVGMAKLNQDTFPKTSLAGEVAKARQHIKSSLECMDQSMNGGGGMTIARIASVVERFEKEMEKLVKRVEALEKKCSASAPAVCPAKCQTPAAKTPTPAKPAKDDDDDVDLFGSESEEEDEEAKKIREQRLAEYAAKKSKKPALVAKSNIILDIKPWDDETDMKEMEKAVRAINMDGLVWGASKLVPVAFKIFKLQISCVIEDDKVSVDVLTETLEAIEDYIQSVDIAAFNKV